MTTSLKVLQGWKINDNTTRISKTKAWIMTHELMNKSGNVFSEQRILFSFVKMFFRNRNSMNKWDNRTRFATWESLIFEGVTASDAPRRASGRNTPSEHFPMIGNWLRRVRRSERAFPGRAIPSQIPHNDADTQYVCVSYVTNNFRMRMSDCVGFRDEWMCETHDGSNGSQRNSTFG